MSRRKSLVLGFLGLGTLLIGYWLWLNFRPYESNSWVDISWKSGGRPMTATVTVVEFQGAGIPDMFVHVDNDSGGNGATTDYQGKATISLGEAEVTGIDLNNIRVMDRSGLLGLFAPSVSSGLEITIVVKDRSRFNSPRSASPTPAGPFALR